jgi:hypothetical protein
MVLFFFELAVAYCSLLYINPLHGVVTCSTVDRYLGCFHFLALTNKATVDSFVHVFVGIRITFLNNTRSCTHTHTHTHTHTTQSTHMHMVLHCKSCV